MSCSEESLIDWNSHRVSKELFRLLPVPLLLLDETGRICWNNQAWAEEVTVHGLPSNSPDSSHGRRTRIQFDGQQLTQVVREFLAGDARHADTSLGQVNQVGREAIGLLLFRTTQPTGALVAMAHRPEAEPCNAEATESVLPWLTVDREVRITDCSPVLLEHLDLSLDVIQGTPVWEIVHPDDREISRQTLLNACTSGLSATWMRHGQSGRQVHSRTQTTRSGDPGLSAIEARPQRPTGAASTSRAVASLQVGRQMRFALRSGDILTFQAHALPIKSASEEFHGLRIVLFDVTERERAQEALSESRDLYRTLAECCGVGVWHISQHGDTLYANPVMCDLLEIDSPNELTSDALNKFFPPASRERILAEEQQRQSGQVSQYEVELIGKRGTRRHVQVTGATLPDGDYHFSGFLGTFIDITASQKRELELRQTQKMEAVGRLAAGIAHEINTPIQFAGDSIQFLRDALQEVGLLLSRYREAFGSDPSALAHHREQLRGLEQEMDFEYLQEQMPKAIDRSLEGLNRVAAIVRAMKAFANPDDGRKGHVDLNQALLNTLTIARNEYKYVADVVTDFGELPPVFCNLSELNQVFLNLLVNAAQAIGEKARQQINFRGEIHIVTHVDGDHIAVTISDTGTGIPVAIRHKIFDPFFTTKPVGSSTGQGLTVAHSVVERHGGTITFMTEEGKGTSFTIQLPIHGVSPSTAEEARA